MAAWGCQAPTVSPDDRNCESHFQVSRLAITPVLQRHDAFALETIATLADLTTE